MKYLIKKKKNTLNLEHKKKNNLNYFQKNQNPNMLMKLINIQL